MKTLLEIYLDNFTWIEPETSKSLPVNHRKIAKRIVDAVSRDGGLGDHGYTITEVAEMIDTHVTPVRYVLSSMWKAGLAKKVYRYIGNDGKPRGTYYIILPRAQWPNPFELFWLSD